MMSGYSGCAEPQVRYQTVTDGKALERLPTLDCLLKKLNCVQKKKKKTTQICY